MPQKTNLNINPYYDDFDKANNFYRVLFKPGYPIQARELTTLQSILQSQIESFGSHIFKEGSMVIPGGVTYDRFFEAVKITKIANATFLGTLAPFFTLVFELFILKRFYNKNVLVGLLFTFIGSLIIMGYQFDLSSKYTIGNIYAVLCSLSIAGALMIGEDVRKNESTVVYTELYIFRLHLHYLLLHFL